MNFEEAENLVSNAVHPESVFTDVSSIKTDYRVLASLLHPDVNKNSPASVFAFQNLTKWYTAVQKKIADNTYGNKLLATITSKKAVYEIHDIVGKDDICDIYSSTNEKVEEVIVKILRSPANRDLMLNERRNLSYLQSESPSKGLKVMAHISTLIDSFEAQVSGKKTQISVMASTKGLHTLTKVRERYPDGVDMRTAAWIWNRMLGSFIAVHQAGLVHGAVIPDHFLICPEDHNGVLVDWYYSVKEGQKVKAISAKWKSFYPTEILNKAEVGFSSDIYMSAMCVIYMLGGNPETREIPKTVPTAIQGLIRYCLLGKKQRPQDAYDFHTEFQSTLKQIYGEPKFHPFSM